MVHDLSMRLHWMTTSWVKMELNQQCLVVTLMGLSQWFQGSTVWVWCFDHFTWLPSLASRPFDHCLHTWHRSEPAWEVSWKKIQTVLGMCPNIRWFGCLFRFVCCHFIWLKWMVQNHYKTVVRLPTWVWKKTEPTLDCCWHYVLKRNTLH